ncbi:MAG: hypothetical protein ACQES4_11605 [Bacillota bacterium]
MKVKWNLEHVYFYLVCFISLILIIFGAVTLAQAGIAYITPVFDDYRPYTIQAPFQELEEWEKEFGPELVEKEKTRFETINRENYFRSLIRDTVSGLIFIAVALPVYFYHWWKIPRLEENL